MMTAIHTAGGQADTLEQVIAGVHSYCRRNAGALVAELSDFVRVPNNVFEPEAIQRNARHLEVMLERRGFSTEQWPTPSGRPLVFAELPAPGASRTLLIYSHYDGVPVEEDAWHSNPYEPVLRDHAPLGADDDWSTISLPANGVYQPEWRLYGRSVADSKNALVAVLGAIDALRAQGRSPQVHLKLLLDGEEEEESPGLPTALTAHSERLAADLMISASGETHQSGRPTVELGMRGILLFELTVHTALVDLHSGHFGNFAPNAALRLAQLLSTLKHFDGTVAVQGFYDEVVPLSASEREALNAIPQLEPQLLERFGIARPEVTGRLLQELINQPTLNMRGLQGGFVGAAARNSIPRSATADIDVRLVKGMDPQRTFVRILAHVERQGYHVVDHPPTAEELRAHPWLVQATLKAGFRAERVPLDEPRAQSIVRAVTAATDPPVVVMPTSGGSLPIYLFAERGLPVISVPISNYDCNQHTADENLQLGFLFRAVAIFAALLSRMPE